MSIKIKDNVTPKLKKFTTEISGNAKDFIYDTSVEWKKSTQMKLGGTSSGLYPAKRTGNLQSSVNRDGPQIEQTGKITTGILTVDTEYATIQEEGGQAGRYLATKIPPRPYATPSIVEVWAKKLKEIGKYIMEPFK